MVFFVCMCVSTGFESATLAAFALIFTERKGMFAKCDKWLYKRGCAHLERIWLCIVNCSDTLPHLQYPDSSVHCRMGVKPGACCAILLLVRCV